MSERERETLDETAFNERQWPNIEVSIASLTGSIVEFREV